MATSPTVSTSVPQPSFTDDGIVLPDESDILTGVATDLNAAFGNTLRFYDSNGTFLLSRPQGQIASSETAIINDVNTMLAWFANNVDPNVASGRMQDAIGAIYFLSRKSATYTTTTCLCTGAVGTLIPAGSKAKDTSANIYASQADATIGSDGTVSVVFVCTTSGPISCAAGTLTTIYQIIPGWDTITNSADGLTGTDLESRADFEARRSESVAVNGSGTTGAILASVRAVDAVIDAYVAENTTSAATTVGGVSVPSYGVLVIVAGGASSDIATAIWSKIPAGTPMGGSTSVTIEDTFNGYTAPLPTYTINYQIAATTPVYVKVTIADSNAVPSTALTSVQAAALSSFVGTGVNETSMERVNTTIYASDFYADIRALGSWAEIVNIKVSIDNATWADTVTLTASEVANLVSTDVTLTLQ